NITGGHSFEWAINSVTIYNNTPDISYMFRQEGNNTITLAATSLEECTRTFSEVVNVIPFGFINKNEIRSLCYLDSILDLSNYIRNYSNSTNIFLNGMGLNSPYLNLNSLAYGHHTLTIEKVISG